jgi:D-lactate dehydrogenase (cytochrome)
MTHDCSFLSDLDLEGAVSFDDSARESHVADWVTQEAGLGVTPDAVVWPECTADVSAVLEAANEREVPVTPTLPARLSRATPSRCSRASAWT